MAHITGKLVEVLKNKKTVVTRAVFWKIPHNSKKDDVCLKVGRYKKNVTWNEYSEEPDNKDCKSELTLDNEEFIKLIEFIQNNYEPFKQGTKAFIPLDEPFKKENANQIQNLFKLPDTQKIVNFILQNNIIPEELEAGLLRERRIGELKTFENMLEQNLTEPYWQKWFQKNDWVLGSEFVRILDERYIDKKNIADFLMEAYDGFVDIIEIKRPEGGLNFWAKSTDHGNHYPSSDLTKAITQSSQYILEVERESNSDKFIKQLDGVKTVKPRCILIFGRSNDWATEQQEAYRVLNSSFHNLTIMTYDHVLQRAHRILGQKKC